MKLATLFLISSLLPVAAVRADRAPFDVRVRPAFARAPAEVVVTVFVEPTIQPRELQVMAESPEYFRASTIALDGVNSAREHRFEWHAFPPGEYVVTAVVRNWRGEERSTHARLEVMP